MYILQPLLLGIYIHACLVDALLDGWKEYFNYFTGYEYCGGQWINFNATSFQEDLQKHLYGQHIVLDNVGYAVKSHFRQSKSSTKALTMSFHGWQGNGKNFVAEFIAKHYFKNGLKSKFFHFFNGRLMFPLERNVHSYRNELRLTVENALTKCPQSIFVFDEVDKIPAGVLDILKPYLDFRHREPDTRKAIFIFLSNAGSQAILDKYLEFWRQGRSRENLTLNDFDNTLQSHVFNEKGGLHKSDTIQSSLIDHYIPFLPLEKHHVVKCIQREIYQRQMDPRYRSIVEISVYEITNEVLKTITFGPEPENLFSHSGCKRVTQQVATQLEKLLWHLKEDL